MKSYLKYIAVILVRQFLKLAYLLPLKKQRIIFSSYEGLQYTCNPKYIFERMISIYPTEYEYVWVLNSQERLPVKYRDCVKVAGFLSLRHIYYMMTAGAIISNLGIEPIFPKRKQQKFINTWHGGGAYKRVSEDMAIFSTGERYYKRKMRKIRSRNTDYFVSSCRRFTEVAAHDFDIEPDVFIPSGMPRNDRLVGLDKGYVKQAHDKFCDEFHIPREDMLVLYAPTFRGSYRNQSYIANQVCCKTVENALKGRFGKNVTFLLRSHISHNNDRIGYSDEHVSVVDVTDISDMQVLLEIADVLITDYSSSIWDFCITERPGFIFAPDLQAYINDFGFYTPIDKWPYPYSETVGGLCKLIEKYRDSNNCNRVVAHHRALGSYESGDAANKIIEIIIG